MIWGAVIVAAGRGTRFGRPKQLVPLAGKPMIAWSVATFAAMPEVVDLVVVTEREFIVAVRDAVRDAAPRMPVTVVEGGAQRQDSVRAGLAALPERCAAAFVHDGARPLVHPNDVRSGMRVVRPGVASLLATPAIDTIKQVDRDGKVVRTFDRAQLWAAQTPQFAMLSDMLRAHRDAQAAGVHATDDATLLERLGCDVLVVEGSPANFKVTVPADLVRAEAVLRERAVPGEGEEEVLLLEAFVAPAAIDDVAREIEARGGRLDGIDRELPSGGVVRAYVAAPALRGFTERIAAVAGSEAIVTTHFSHYGPRT
jgi:2-C-methyl-D-erythritol 4-phosphate cytidylyltransferase